MGDNDGDDVEDFEYYTHIMLIGQTVENVMFAASDRALSQKRRIYLIHSPNQKKSSLIPYLYNQEIFLDIIVFFLILIIGFGLPLEIDRILPLVPAASSIHFIFYIFLSNIVL